MRRVIVTLATNARSLERLAALLAPQDFDAWQWVAPPGADFSIDALPAPVRERTTVVTAGPGGLYAACTDPDAVYLKLDEAIAWLCPDFCRLMWEYRAWHHRPFLTHGNCVGSPGLAFVHDRLGVVPTIPEGRPASTDPEDHVAASEAFAAASHESLLAALAAGDTSPWAFDTWALHGRETVPLVATCWFGRDFEPFRGSVGSDDRAFLCRDRPAQLDGLSGSVCGRALCALAFPARYEDAYPLPSPAAPLPAASTPQPWPAPPAAAAPEPAHSEPATPEAAVVAEVPVPKAPRKRRAAAPSPEPRPKRAPRPKASVVDVA